MLNTKKNTNSTVRGELAQRSPKPAKELPRYIPLLSNLALLQRATDLLRQIVEDSAGRVAKALSRILGRFSRGLLLESVH